MTCPNPEFAWTGVAWSACIRCGRLAWSHEQADPVADVRNLWRGGDHDPPVMRRSP